MPGNSIGKIFRVTTFGESHGVALGCVIDGMPPGIPLTEIEIQRDLDRRRPGTSRYISQRNEFDKIAILSGVFKGKTTGTSIGLLINNMDQRSEDYKEIKDIFRPGHADYTYEKKYGVRDYRGGGRSSARETAMRVAAGAVAKKYMKIKHGIRVRGYLAQIGDIVCDFEDWNIVDQNSFFCPNLKKIDVIDKLIGLLQEEGDSIGAKITIQADNVPLGLGEPVFDRFDSDLAHALMSINAVKAVEIGDGLLVVTQRGSEHRDEICKNGFRSNHSGGVLGGITTGQVIKVNLALKPTSSIKKPGNSITSSNEEVIVVTKGRHDPCVGIRAIPVAESMMSIVLMDHLLRNRAQCG